MTSLRDVSWAFSNCISLKKLNLLNIDQSTIKGLNFVFGKCQSLREIQIGTVDELLNRSDTTLIGCKSLEKIITPTEVIEL